MTNDADPDWRYCEGRRLHLRPHPGTQCEPWNWKSITAVFGLAAGLASLVFGALADAAGFFGGRSGPLLMKVGTLLLLLSIPLLAAGACCLDLEEGSAVAARHARESPAGAGKARRR